MMQPRSKWRGALWTFPIIVVLYAYSVYNSFFATELGYVYDPTTDRLFELNLTLNVSTCDKWTPLTPFKHCFLGKVGHVEYQGTLETIEANHKLARENPKAWIESQNSKIEALLDGNAAKEPVASWDIDYYWRQAVPVSELLPKRLSPLIDSTTDQNTDLIAVDVVIARRTSFDKPADIEVVRSAVLIRGRAARRFATWMGVWELDELPS